MDNDHDSSKHKHSDSSCAESDDEINTHKQRPSCDDDKSIRKHLDSSSTEDDNIRKHLDSASSGDDNPRDYIDSASAEDDEEKNEQDSTHKNEQRKNSKCFACTRGDLPTGLHKCDNCHKAIHLLDGCSVSIGDNEGCGEKRRCIDCFKVSKTNTNSQSAVLGLD